MARESILIADDERFVREVCVRAAREDGYQISSVASGTEAVQAAQEQHFDLFLTDLRMPGMTGLEAFEAVAKIQPDIIGMAMTGYATMEAAIQALQLGFHDFILKPFSPNDVRQAIARALERRRLREENARLRALIPFYELTRALVSITSQDDLLERVIELAMREGHADAVGLLLLNELNSHLTLRAARGFGDHALDQQILASEGGVASVGDDAQPLIWAREEIAKLPFGRDTHTMITVPLITQGQTLGLMACGKTSPDDGFGESDLELLSVLAGQAAAAIRNAQLFEEIQRAYRKVEESDFLKSEFIAIASHELRTPLASILGYIELLTDGASGDDLQQLNIVLEQALHLRDVVNDMLSLTDLHAGMAEISWGEITLPGLVQQAIHDERIEMESKNLKVQARIPEDCEAICGDYERIRLILGKLLSNAVKFSPPNTQIDVVAQRDPDRIVISVIDRGPGIAQGDQANLFRPFYQVEESLRRTHGGMGLGLAIAKGMVELHGGQIWVESRAGDGSCFSFSIPQDHPEE